MHSYVCTFGSIKEGASELTLLALDMLQDEPAGEAGQHHGAHVVEAVVQLLRVLQHWQPGHRQQDKLTTQ